MSVRFSRVSTYYNLAKMRNALLYCVLLKKKTTSTLVTKSFVNC